MGDEMVEIGYGHPLAKAVPSAPGTKGMHVWMACGAMRYVKWSMARTPMYERVKALGKRNRRRTAHDSRKLLRARQATVGRLASSI
jgi:hypothetical protein